MKSFPILAILRIFIGSIFLWSGFLKLIEPWQNFQVVIEAYQILQGEPVRWIARLLPWCEALGGLYLIAGLYIRPAAAVVWALNSFFVAALASAVARKLPIQDCGCFGDSFSLPLPVMLAVDTALWFGFGAIYFWDEQARRWSLDSKYAVRLPVTTRRKK